MSTEPLLNAETVAVERAALRTLLDWYDEPEQDTWGLDVVHAAQRLRLQLDHVGLCPNEASADGRSGSELFDDGDA